ncbi:MAG: Na(+)/H(+) antiporter subunit D [Spirochaetaceae bacterium]|nr:Na(+)/H(+) antiporter subunit D [Spirochaetaceae bacterium]|tara:strand:+ start:29036 stop:30790 length:1755 start_codon:yes stop_codon:yes gene_type:complete
MIEFLQIPAVILLSGALIVAVLPSRIRSFAFLIFPAAALASLWSFPDEHVIRLSFATYELVPLKIDALSRVFGTIFSLVGVVGGIYALHIQDRTQQINALLYSAGALGVTLAGDFFTLFVFWEMMAVSSAYLIWARRTEDSDRAGMRYLMMHFLGGGLLFSGILLQLGSTGSILIQSFEYEFSITSVLILLGVSLNAAVPPLHAWLSDAYPRATITGAVFMSALTTKSAMYVLIRLYPGWEVLVWVGIVMALYGAVYALMADDIREILAFSIISQLGYMVTAVGIGTEMAINGAATHAFSHILYKSLLFMAAGAVIYATGRSRLSELGGLASRMKWVLVLYMVGGASISGLPLFNGFISKSMIISAAGEAHYEWAMLLLMVASIGSFLHTGLKLPYFTWIAPARGQEILDSTGKPRPPVEVRPLPSNMMVAMFIGAALCIFFGVYPFALYEQLPYASDYNPFTLYHFVETAQLLVIALGIFWALKSWLAEKQSITLDVDWFYRKPLLWLANHFLFVIGGIYGWFADAVADLAAALSRGFVNPMKWLNPFGSSENESANYSPAMGTAMGFILFVFVILGLFMLLQ